MKSLKSRLKKHEVTITQTADWNKYDERLMRAAERGDAEKVSSTLAKKGVNPSKLDLEGRTAFHVVASKGHLECLNLILVHGVDLTAPDAAGRNALHLSAKYGHSLCLQKLLQFNCPTENVDLQGRTALHDAAMSDCCSSVQLLCDHGASVNAKDGDGRAPVALATQMCRPAICQLLIEKGADINSRDKQNKTPLMLGCEYGCKEAVDVLLRAGADVNLVDSFGHDCAYYSRIGDNLEILAMIKTAMENSPQGLDPVRRIVSLRTRKTKQNSVEEGSVVSKEKSLDLEAENENLRERLRKIQHEQRSLFEKVEGLQLQLNQEQMMSDDLENEKEHLKSILEGKEKELEECLRTMEGLRGKVRYYEQKNYLAQSSPFGKEEVVMKQNSILGVDPQLAAHLPARSQLRPLELPGENTDQRHELETIRRYYEAARDETIKLQQELSRRSSECVALVSERDRCKVESDQQIHQLEDALRDVQKRMLDSEGKVKQMQTHFLALKDHLTQEALSGSSRAEDMEEQLREVKGKYEGASAEVGKLRNQLRHNELLVQELRREDARLRKENRRLQDEVAVCEEERDRAERVTQEAREQLALSVTTDKFENMRCLLTNEVNEKSRALEMAEAELTQVQQELETAHREKKRTEAKLDMLRKEVEEMNVKNHSFGREGEKLQAEKVLLLRQIEDLTAQIKSQHVPAELHAETKRALEVTISQLNQRLAESEKTHRKSEMDMEKLQKEKKVLTENISLLQASSTPKEIHERELTSMKAKAKELERQLAEAQRKREEETARACSLQLENTSFREDYLPLTTHHKATSMLTSELDKTKEDLATLKKQVEKECGEKAVLESELQAECSKRAALQAQADRESLKRADLQAEMKSIVREREELQGQLKTRTEELSDLQAQMRKLKIQVDNEYVKLKVHEEKILELQKQKEQILQELSQAHAKNQQSQEEVLRLQTAIRGQKEELDTLQHCISEKYAPLASIEEREQSFQKSLGALEKELEKERCRSREIQHKLEQHKQDAQDFQKKLESAKLVLQQEKAAQEQEKLALQSQLAETHALLLQLQKSEAEMKQKQQELREQNLKAQNKIGEMKDQLRNQYIPIQEHEDLKAILSTKASLEVQLKEHMGLYEKELEKVKSLEKELEKQKDGSLPLVLHAQEVQAWQKRQAETQKRLQEKEEAAQAAEQQLKQLKDELHTLRLNLQEAEQEKEDCTAARIELEQKVAQMEQSSSKGNEQATQMSQELQKSQEESVKLREKSSVIEHEISQLKGRYDESLATIEELKSRILSSAKDLKDKDKEISALVNDVERLKIAKAQMTEVVGKKLSYEILQSQVVSLQRQLEETQQKHQDIIAIYRSHLLSAAQGHMDADVQDALLQIIHMRQELVF
ncbi:uveal autoantigen with coiled-coil domains and ankyrin repeats isoform X3 [Xenopus tropicalis]|uniref:Uveal autoantigen with coiled-coil domains and ankyrin repeats isoform X3 n=1 Tax=Xenopus tropicalis TaxID=8364 RepID=A0A8J0QXB8_XENTR|nr:uveal autoantigen with coiled-coil domains and ankyrin repeats isoform X3 [Xenopus tropicalis]|eukprot:XP_004912642.1 PREDICTED: uveal autoantigen with coiled-coil domains and ankyrin repeats isoform X3 [Xenopus tropicalis]